MQPVDQFRGLMEAVAADGWQLVVKHRAGSVEAAVERVRLRNLYVSFGILLVLATSIFFLAISVRRARQLARQQLEFVASISHELRTPVTAICSLSENLADGLIQPEEQVRRYGRYILREGRRLGSLVEQALEFAGLSSGRLRCRLRPIDVEPTLREALQSCEAQLQERNAQVDVQIEPGLPKIAGDAESLGCAVQNLIGNAIKYSREAAEISIQAHQLRETREVEIVVADRGMGIDPDELKQVFEPFFRGRKALSSQIRGAGIGLSLVKRIVDAHHGRVLVNNRPGGGTHVTLRLPVTDERSAPANPADARL
jgi:signal transduction histidine kinase